jgi:enhanced entry protein EnhC
MDTHSKPIFSKTNMLKLTVALSFSIMLGGMANAQTAFYDYRKGHYKKAYPGIKKLATQKNKKALFYLGMMKIHGYVVPRNEEDGLSDIKLSAEKGYTKAEKFMGAYYLEEKNDPTKAFFWYKRAAAKNDMLSMMYTASAYLNGYGVKQNRDMARRYITKAAQQGNALAQYELAEMFLASRHRRSKRLGTAWLKKSAKQGNQRAEYKLATLYREGKLLGRNREMAKEWMEKVKTQNHPDTPYLMGEYYRKSAYKPEKMKAVTWHQKGVANGNRDSKFKLGLLYLSPDINIMDKQGAFELIQSAAVLGNTEAQLKLAEMYDKGIAVPINPELASNWKTKAKSVTLSERKRRTHAWISRGKEIQGLFDKEKVAGVFKHWHNKNVKQKGIINQNPSMAETKKSEIFSPQLSMTSPNNIKVYDLFDYIGPVHKVTTPSQELTLTRFPISDKNVTAEEVRKIYGQARLGNRAAQFKMGQFHEDGLVVEKSIPLAMAWYQEAAAQNNLKAEYHIAMIYLYGAGGDKNYGKALYWLNRSAFKGNTKAQYALARIYETGMGDSDSNHSISPDPERAKDMYTLAASEDNAKAKLKLANFLDKEKGTKIETLKDKKKRHDAVRELYEYAAKSGIESAKLPLAFYYASSSNVPDVKKQWAYGVAREAASQGDENASLLVGLMYDRGIGVGKDKSRAISWYETALEKDNLLAQFILGTYYYHGDGVTQYKDKAKQLLGEASNKSLPYADYNLAVIQSRDGFPHLPLVEKAASLNYNKASLYLADEALLNNTDPYRLKSAVNVYHRLAALGYPKALLKLGYMYENGIYFKQNSKKAAEYYLKAAKENDRKAQYLLGNLYLLGKLGRPDPNMATQWYEEAASNGYVPAYLALGFIAEGFQHDYEKAGTWYQRAARSDSGIGQFNLALIYDYGKGGKSNPEKAVKWYEKAAINNITGAKINLAKKYLNGDGVARSEEVAFDWYQNAAKDNDPEAVYQLGLMYEAGVGTQKSMPKAINAYIKSAEKGDKQALLALARIYQSGLGVDIDKARALGFYEKVAKTGNQYAQFQIAKHLFMEKEDKKAEDKAKKMFKRLAKKGYEPAKLVVTQLGIEDKIVKKKKDTKESTKNNEPEKNITMKAVVEDKAVASLMYIDAIKELNRGDTSRSEAVLKRIMVKFPSYEPAKETFKRLEKRVQVTLPAPPPAPLLAPVLSAQSNETTTDKKATE